MAFPVILIAILLSLLFDPLPLLSVLRRRSTLWAAISVPKASKVTNLAVAAWHAATARAALVITKGKGPASMGDHIAGVQYLQPEEAAFLVDRGALDLLVDGVPASQQRVMALLLCPPPVAVAGAASVGPPPPPPMSHDVYAAYGHLRRVGYVVRRAAPDIVAAAATATAGAAGGGARGLGVALTVWKAGAFRRRTPSPPYFHVAVLPYEAAGGRTPVARGARRARRCGGADQGAVGARRAGDGELGRRWHTLVRATAATGWRGGTDGWGGEGGWGHPDWGCARRAGGGRAGQGAASGTAGGG
eukprot:TRINITY_DN4179_c0_g1_i1.p1 TRINITY_DN4179_c0_g1~~TRINITY_DN4179_c0_g1_i1.p1  ORF type:complete len:303 (+),score=47.07 TRINITY_DN4179_c0_g1_i1:399-1307(+)